jgi:hypothetical protein
MSGVYCQRCQTKVLLEQDGRSCSNCGAVLVGPPVRPLTGPFYTKPTTPTPAKKDKPRT